MIDFCRRARGRATGISGDRCFSMIFLECPDTPWDCHICLHWGAFGVQCRHIWHTWSVWDGILGNLFGGVQLPGVHRFYDRHDSRSTECAYGQGYFPMEDADT